MINCVKCGRLFIPIVRPVIDSYVCSTCLPPLRRGQDRQGPGPRCDCGRLLAGGAFLCMHCDALTDAGLRRAAWLAEQDIMLASPYPVRDP